MNMNGFYICINNNTNRKVNIYVETYMSINIKKFR